MFIVGLTGGIASGKSTVAAVFREHGIPVVDADAIARKVVEPGTFAWKNIKKEFGDDVLLPDGNINRARLGEIIFADVDKRVKLNSWTHPQIHRQIAWEAIMLLFSGHSYIVMELPLLFESGIMLGYIYKTICVSCRPEQQLERLLKRNVMTEENAKQRIASQMSLDRKCEKSHYVIDNSGTIDNTQEQAKRILGLLDDSWEHWRIRSIIAVIGAVCLSPIMYYLYIQSGTQEK